jgi:hypothetical protein
MILSIALVIVAFPFLAFGLIGVLMAADERAISGRSWLDAYALPAMLAAVGACMFGLAIWNIL